MSHRGLDPKDYEYDGSTSVDEAQLRADAQVKSSRFKATSAVTTFVLAAAGLLGGTAFAMSNAPAQSNPTGTPVVETSAPAGNQSQAQTTDANPTPAATTEPVASNTSAGATTSGSSGKTIAVPPAAFDDKNGKRDFHGSPTRSAGASSSTSSSTSPTTAASAPSFGGGGEGSDDGGEHHHKRGTAPAPGASTSPNFSNNGDD